MEPSEAAVDESGQGNSDTETADKPPQWDQYAKHTLMIPSCAAWFDFNQIHEIELTSLPEFFCGKFPHKNPRTYKSYRNFIIKLYR